MQYDDLPQRWRDKLRDYLTHKHGTIRERLSLEDFINSSTKINFEDGSSATFMYTLVLEAPEIKEMTIFTEHCGYHIFALGSIESINHNNES